jgi:hypothetical protein
VSTTKNYTAINAWIHGVGTFQITIGKSHDINWRAEEDLAKLGEASSTRSSKNHLKVLSNMR